jgi:hypothetical protein
MRSTIRALLIVTALLIATSSPSHAKSTRRVLASAGPSFVSTKDGALNTGLDVGTGFEVGDPVVRWSLRLDLHGVRQDHTSWHAMTGLACVRVMLAPSDAAVRPYLWGGAGYGSALAYSDFILPAAAGVAAGIEIARQAGTTWFLEVGTSWAKESQMTALRLGATLR